MNHFVDGAQVVKTARTPLALLFPLGGKEGACCIALVLREWKWGGEKSLSQGSLGTKGEERLGPVTGS